MQASIRIYDMGCKEVIDTRTGQRIGFVRDAEINMENGRVEKLIIPGKLRFFGLFGREDEKTVPWECIEKLGEDFIFVNLGTRRKALPSIEQENE